MYCIHWISVRFYKVLIVFSLSSALLIGGGCAGTGKKVSSINEISQAEPADIGDIKIREFFLSPGDELKISVYQHEELTRPIKIPPDGIIFYPIVGEIDTKVKSLRELRDIITTGLSKYKKHTFLPGDEISISVLRNGEYNRRFIIPSDGNIFFAYIGFINIEGKSIEELTNIIAQGLSKYLVDPQVMIDIVALNNPARIADPQVSIEVTGFSGQKVFVLGEVNKPGVFLADGHMTTIELISLAGGPTLDANQKSVLLIRTGTDKKRHELFLIDLDSALREGNLTQNPVLHRGDIIFVPRTFIANVDRFFEHLKKIVSPLVDLETGYWIGQNIGEGPRVGSARVLP